MKIRAPLKDLPARYVHRRAQTSDQDAIQNLVFSTLREYGLVPEPDAVDADLYNVVMEYADGYFGVILDQEQIVATFALSPLSDVAVEIRKMYSIPSVRGKGLGRWMVSYLMQLAKENGYKEVELETASALVEAISLYQKMGFIEKGFENKTPRCDKAFVFRF